jgi:hypothetical protein
MFMKHGSLWKCVVLLSKLEHVFCWLSTLGTVLVFSFFRELLVHKEFEISCKLTGLSNAKKMQIILSLLNLLHTITLDPRPRVHGRSSPGRLIGVTPIELIRLREVVETKMKAVTERLQQLTVQRVEQPLPRI